MKDSQGLAFKFAPPSNCSTAGTSEYVYATSATDWIGMNMARDWGFTTRVAESIWISVHGPQWLPRADPAVKPAVLVDPSWCQARASLAHTPFTEASRAVWPSAPTHNTDPPLSGAYIAARINANTAAAAKTL